MYQLPFHHHLTRIEAESQLLCVIFEEVKAVQIRHEKSFAEDFSLIS
jgi:hypothetical protein